MRILLPALLLSALPAFAGDRYLICETPDGEPVASSAIVRNRGAVTFNQRDFTYVVLVNEDRVYNEYEFTRVDRAQGGYYRQVSRNSDDMQPVPAAPGVDCRITD